MHLHLEWVWQGDAGKKHPKNMCAGRNRFKDRAFSQFALHNIGLAFACHGAVAASYIVQYSQQQNVDGISFQSLISFLTLAIRYFGREYFIIAIVASWCGCRSVRVTNLTTLSHLSLIRT